MQLFRQAVEGRKLNGIAFACMPKAGAAVLQRRASRQPSAVPAVSYVSRASRQRGRFSPSLTWYLRYEGLFWPSANIYLAYEGLPDPA
jgi:hypothetical protein